MYDELREILTDDIVMRDADLFASQHTNGTLKPAKKDKGEEWYEKLVEVFFKVFDSSKRDFWMHSWWHIDNEMKDWHLSRLERELNSTSEAYTVSDGWSIPEGTTMVVGTCHICYAKAVRKKAELGEEWDDETFKSRWGDKGLYMSPLAFTQHWVIGHPGISFKKQFGPGGDGYFTYMTGVEGAEPIRVGSMDAIPVLLIP